MSEPVKRYNMDLDKFSHVRAYESEHGRWVKRDDYAALEAERDALRAQVEVMRVALEVAALAMWNSEANMDNEAAAAEEALADAAMQAKP